MSKPKILLLDEPAGGLGPEDIEWIKSLIRNIKAHTSVLLVQHHVAGYGLSMQTLGKVFTVMGKLKATMTTGAWPDTSPDALKNSGIPARSALVLLGLMAGLPSQSAHFDGTTGPGSVNSSTYTGFSLLYSPALAMLENGTNAAALGVLANADVEAQSGGVVFDNSKTDYTARLGSDASAFSAPLSGSTATNALLGYLAQAPRVTADPAAVVKMHAIATNTNSLHNL